MSRPGNDEGQETKSHLPGEPQPLKHVPSVRTDRSDLVAPDRRGGPSTQVALPPGTAVTPAPMPRWVRPMFAVLAVVIVLLVITLVVVLTTGTTVAVRPEPTGSSAGTSTAPTSSSAGAPTTSATRPPTTSSGGATSGPTSAPSTAGSAQPGGTSIAWQGLLRVNEDGVNFDTIPPSPANHDGVYIKHTDWTLYGGPGVLFAYLSGDGSKQECTDLLKRKGRAFTEDGNDLGQAHCFQTPGGRIGRLTNVDSTTSTREGYQLEALIWN
ncbi:hypothetical protein F0L68_39015 [Solihabitans fulvus]|uniref:Uncharacterized protein n=1 Tax=Solihabitans fulvus TaxID=1892852 RepID=A0A5B2WJ95_9PSEU|nr:hypothetical protein [Solihabitans fulvus]KAA2250137.1 hypothetical protein F0L68_39015 [Solihabitans fulvus]